MVAGLVSREGDDEGEALGGEEEGADVGGEGPGHFNVAEDEAFVVGAAFEGDAGLFADGAFAAVAGGEVAGAGGLGLGFGFVAGLPGELDVVGVLGEGEELGGAGDGAAEGVEAIKEEGLGALLREEQHVGVVGLELAEVDGREGSFTFAELEVGGADAFGDQGGGDAEGFEDLEGAGVDDGGARGVEAGGEAVEDEGGVAEALELGGEGEAGGAGADDNQVLEVGSHAGLLERSCCDVEVSKATVKWVWVLSGALLWVTA